MKKSSLLQEISKAISKKEAASLAKQNLNAIAELLKLCSHSNYEIAFRAAWILEMVVEGNVEPFNQYLNEFIGVYLKLQNQSGQRHFTKILISLTHSGIKRDRLLTDKIEAIVETTFEWLIDPQTPVAVRVNCMDILFNLKGKNDWIADELRAQIEFQLHNGSPALQSRGKKVLHKLSKSEGKSH